MLGRLKKWWYRNGIDDIKQYKSRKKLVEKYLVDKKMVVEVANDTNNTNEEV